MVSKDKLNDMLQQNYQGPEDIVGEHEILNQLNRKILERALQAELNHNLWCGK